MAANFASPPMPSPALVENAKFQLPASCDPPSPANPSQQRVWVIFGATGHIGWSVVKAALAHDDLVTAVGRTFEDTIEAMEASLKRLDIASHLSPASMRNKASSQHLNGPTPKHAHQRHSSSVTESTHVHDRSYLPLLCDVRVRSTIETVFRASIQHWGRYDIVANCAGYGLIGACEEQDEFQIRGQFETNFWGTLNILQLSLPYFRNRAEGSRRQSQEAEYDDEDGEGYDNGQEGRYLIFSSTSGALGVPGLGPYCATKYAVEGLVESLLYETAAFDIRATLVEPGHVRRDDGPFSSSSTASQSDLVPPKRSTGKSEKSKLSGFGHFSILPHPPGSVYANPTSPAHHAKRVVQWLGDRQPTNAAKAAELVWQLGHCRYPPLRLLLGAFAVDSVRERMRGLTEEIEDWKGLSFPVNGGDGDGFTSSPAKARGRGSKSECQEEDREDTADADRDVKMEED